jgi:hypothetical protein
MCCARLLTRLTPHMRSTMPFCQVGQKVKGLAVESLDQPVDGCGAGGFLQPRNFGTADACFSAHQLNRSHVEKVGVTPPKPIRDGVDRFGAWCALERCERGATQPLASSPCGAFAASDASRRMPPRRFQKADALPVVRAQEQQAGPRAADAEVGHGVACRPRRGEPAGATVPRPAAHGNHGTRRNGCARQCAQINCRAHHATNA